MRLKEGEMAPEFDWQDMNDNPVSLRAMQGRYAMLSFYRYASCPFCNLRVNELSQRAASYQAGGVEMIAVFQSPAEKIKRYAGRQDPPFPILPDPARHLYQLYGVERSWLGMVKAFVGRSPSILSAFGKGYLPGSMEGEVNRLPADFIIGKSGEILAAYYGQDIGDHMPYEMIERFIV